MRQFNAAFCRQKDSTVPVGNPYIPPKDSDFNNWLNNFSTLLSANPALYGLTTADAANVATATSAWSTAYAAAIAGPTRGPASIQTKNDQRVNATAVARPLAVAISLNAGVSADDKLAIGVNPRTSGLTPIVAPTSNPILSLIGAQHLAHFLRYQDSASPASVRAKPFGATQMQLVGATSATVVTDQNTLPLIAVYTKVPVKVYLPPSAMGQTMYYAARWQTRTGLCGPWSPILPLVVI